MDWNKNLTLKESITVKDILNFADKIINAEVVDNAFEKGKILIGAEYIFRNNVFYATLAIKR